MSNISKQHADVLELGKVLSLLAGRAPLQDAKAAALALEPETDLEKVKILLSQTDDAYRLCAGYGSPSFGNLVNVSGVLSRAAGGGVLSMEDLLHVAETLRTTRSLKEWRARCETADAEYIDPFFAALTPNRYFEDKIFSCVKGPEEMDDGASDTLRNIRRRIRSSELNAKDRLENMIRSQRFSKFLQDAIITQRGGRYVIPVKSEHRAEVSGLLHDTSSSGATLFIEPMAIVEINNEIRELQTLEAEEIERILAELSAEAAGFADNINASFENIVALCVIFAKASLAFDMKAAMPRLNRDGRIYLKNARHPLLDKRTVVPVTVMLGDEFDTLIITGPNTGGKTVTIKTLGLMTLMAMCGMLLPASDGSEISVFDHVLADIGDEQSIEQSLSTFSAHMKRMISITETADSHSLVLIDELGAGTDPVEGAALAAAILMKLREKGAKIAATTHYAELKSFALETPGVCNASCEFDVQSLRPTYRLNIGLPGRSNAFAISERLGLSKDIVDLAKSLVSDEDARFEHVVGILENAVQKAEEDRREAARIRGEAEALKASNKRLEDELSAKREKAMEKAREQAAAIIERTRAEAERLLFEIESSKTMKATAEERIRQARASFKSGLSKLEDAADPVATRAPGGGFTAPLKKGDTVELADIRKVATVLEDQNGDDVLILAGAMKTRVKVDALRPAAKTAPAGTRSVKKAASPETAVRTAASEIDIRGMTGDEAALELDRFIDGSVMAGLSTVWIIHGKGTGALKKAVRAYLSQNRSVASFRPGVYGEGEDGVTVVTLR